MFETGLITYTIRTKISLAIVCNQLVTQQILPLILVIVPATAVVAVVNSCGESASFRWPCCPRS